MAQGFGLGSLFGNRKRMAARMESLVGGQTKITGDVTFAGGLHINGTVHGNVSAPDDPQAMLTISAKGCVEGDVTVARVLLDGTVRGDVHASEQVELAANARVHGDVHYRVIEMAMGAEVVGRLIRLPEPGRPPLALSHSAAKPDRDETAT